MKDGLITAVVDRPLGSAHPAYPELIYPVNYGYVPGIPAGDGEEQDVYILGVDRAVDRFTGRLIALIRRADDGEDKWVLAPEGARFSEEEIAEAVRFQERFFRSEIIVLPEDGSPGVCGGELGTKICPGCGADSAAEG